MNDQASYLVKLKSLIPRGWYPDDSPTLDMILSGPAWMLAFIDSLLAYVKLQTRISTATDRNLDLIATDYLGTRISRRALENDTSFRARIKRELLRKRGTRAAMDSALYDLTGVHPRIFEYANTNDTGGYAHGSAYAGMAYGIAGGYGSYTMPFQFQVDAYRPIESGGVANVDGYGGYLGGYGVGAIEWISTSQIVADVTDQDILDAINATRPAATIAWTRISAAK